MLNNEKKITKIVGTLVAVYGIILIPLIGMDNISQFRLGAIALLSVGMIISVIIEIKKINKEFD
ncbi:hypothetical protein [Lactobacillus sp. LL6]|uniref:hypothetical protein n=1 Tax=unclassified Lactobacillus TaxID=2620435 RepID=UPI00118623E0|nr:hypothetical protein [Lactobacillus sp. LL6]TSO26886.1 hypothetical protein FOD82_07650 [Lactobacillus sp. LL6]